MNRARVTVFLLVFAASCLLIGCLEPSPTPPSGVEPIATPAPQPEPENPDAAKGPALESPQTPAPLPDATGSSLSYSWGFRRNNEHRAPEISSEMSNLLNKYQALYVAPGDGNRIYLTFDAGYEQGYTATILDILKDKQVPAAFFITGHYLHTQPELVKRMKAEGHLVCNHTVNHPDLSTISQEKFTREIDGLAHDFAEITGQKMDPYLRPPMGIFSEQSLYWAREMGYTTVLWSLAFADWDPAKQPGADFSFRQVVDYIHPGAIILLHAVSQSDTEALPRIIEELRNQGYTFAIF
jgi:peptidoglycan-N-acetylmuramic acid deacetylase